MKYFLTILLGNLSLNTKIRFNSMSKNKIIKEFKTPKEIHDELFACINCEFEDLCSHILPFPLNLCEKCKNYRKKDYDY